MQLEIALALSNCATAEVNIVRFVTWVCLVICMIPPFIPFPSSSNIYPIAMRNTYNMLKVIRSNTVA